VLVDALVSKLLKKAAQAKTEKTETDILQTKNGGVFKIAKAIADLQETKGRLISKKAALDQAKKELNQTLLTAPFDGIAILYETFRDGEKRKPRVGDRVLRNQPILYLPDITSMVVKTNIREVDLNKISLHQKAKIHVDAYPDTNLEGAVDFMGALASEVHGGGMGGKYFQLTVAVNTEDLRLRPGMTARVTIVASRIKDTLSVPVSAHQRRGAAGLGGTNRGRDRQASSGRPFCPATCSSSPSCSATASVACYRPIDPAV